jgi:hypothetical protein
MAGGDEIVLAFLTQRGRSRAASERQDEYQRRHFPHTVLIHSAAPGSGRAEPPFARDNSRKISPVCADAWSSAFFEESTTSCETALVTPSFLLRSIGQLRIDEIGLILDQLRPRDAQIGPVLIDDDLIGAGIDLGANLPPS